jgi:hypothetical protein
MLRALVGGTLRLSHGMTAGRIRNPSCSPETRQKLEFILRCFIDGYNFALTSKSNEKLALALDAGFDAHHVGFAYEGAGMALTVLDLLKLTKSSRLKSFVTEVGEKHDYIAMVGAGLAVARMRWAGGFTRSYFSSFDPLLSWCMPDGFGFHQGFFSPDKFVDHQENSPPDFTPAARQLFDSGIGRSLWWTCGASPQQIAATIARFPEDRRGEIWCGIGVACSYAGGDDGSSLSALLELAGRHHVDFLSGLPFAARMRQKAGNTSPVTENACRKLLGQTADETADMAQRLLEKAEATLGDRAGRDGYAFVRLHLTENLTQETTSSKALSG